MPSITGVQITELAEAVVSFDLAVSAEMSSGQLWDLEPVAATSAESSVYDAEYLGGLLVKVWLSPWLSPDQSYTITAYPGGIATSFTFSAPNLPKALGGEWYHGALKAISRTCGQMIQEFTGRPETILTQDIDSTDKHVFVESTLGFPQAGSFFVAEREYRYTSKRPASFRDVTVDEVLPWVQTAHQRVTANPARVLPASSAQFLAASGDGTNGVL
jgi:hypothetical protein